MKKRVNRWLETNLISTDQASAILEDYEIEKEQKRRVRTQITLYSIGALLLGLGVILFIAANNWIWEIFFKSNIIKIICLTVLTLGTYWTGYLLKYEKAKFPRLGGSLIFLSALFVGATYALIGQIYNINANSSSLILLWLLSIIPLAFIHKSNSINILSILLFLIWIPLFYFLDNSFFTGHKQMTVVLVPILTGLFLYSFGNMPLIKEKLLNFSITYKIFGLILISLMLFVLTFFKELILSTYSICIYIPIFLITVMTLLFTRIEKEKNRLLFIETVIILGLMILFMLLQGNILGYWGIKILSHGLYITVLWLGFQYGYKFENFKLINLSSFLLIIYVIARYFEWSWHYLDKSLFFVIGGLILLGIGYSLEKQKRALKTQKGDL